MNFFKKINKLLDEPEKEGKKYQEFRDTKMQFYSKEKRETNEKNYKNSNKKYLDFIISNSQENIEKGRKRKRHKSLPRRRITLEKAIKQEDSVIEFNKSPFMNSSHLDSSSSDKKSSFFKIKLPKHKIMRKEQLNFFKSKGKEKKEKALKLQTNLAVKFFNSLESCGNEVKLKEESYLERKKNRSSLNNSILSKHSAGSNSSTEKYNKDSLKKTISEILKVILKERNEIEEGSPKYFVRNLLFLIEKFAESNTCLAPIFEIFNKKAKDMLLLTSEKKLEHIKDSISKVLSWSKVLEITTFISVKFSFLYKKKKKKKRKPFNPGLKVNIFLGQTVQDALDILTQSMNNIGDIKMKFEKMLKSNISKYKKEIKNLKKINNDQTENFAEYLKRIEGNFKKTHMGIENDLKKEKNKNLELQKEVYILKETLERLQTTQGESRATQLSYKIVELTEKLDRLENEIFEKKSENLKLSGKVSFLSIELDLAKREVKNKSKEIKSVELQFKEFEKNQVSMQMFKKSTLSPKLIQVCEFFRLMSTQEKSRFFLLPFKDQISVMRKRIKNYFEDVMSIMNSKDKQKIKMLLINFEGMINKASKLKT